MAATEVANNKPTRYTQVMEVKDMKDKYKCPRCAGYIPNNIQVGQYVGALSRTDNKTEICSSCGTAEALEQFVGALMPQSQWAEALV